MGKLALIECEGKDPWLVGDSKASGASPAARFPERAKHPRAVDVQTGLTRLQEAGNLEADPWAAVTIDIKAAHKRMLLREEDAGLSFFTFLGVLYRFVTCHFGAGLSGIRMLLGLDSQVEGWLLGSLASGTEVRRGAPSGGPGRLRCYIVCCIGSSGASMLHGCMWMIPCWWPVAHGFIRILPSVGILCWAESLFSPVLVGFLRTSLFPGQPSKVRVLGPDAVCVRGSADKLA